MYTLPCCWLVMSSCDNVGTFLKHTCASQNMSMCVNFTFHECIALQMSAGEFLCSPNVWPGFNKACCEFGKGCSHAMAVVRAQ